MTVMYNEFKESLLMTMSECKELYTPDVIFLVVIAIILGIMGIIGIILIAKCVRFSMFIKENKLQEKYKEWKELNKGLNF